MSMIAKKPDFNSGTEASFTYQIKNTCDLWNDQGNVEIGNDGKANEKSDSATCLVDLEKVKNQYEIWHDSFRGKIRPFYAVKCNPDPEIIKTLALLGAGFDCASQSEIETVLKVGEDLKAKLGSRYMGIGPERIGFFHPCKMRSHLRYAKEMDVRKMTFDSINELEKIAEIYFGGNTVYEPVHCPEIFLRITVNDKSSQCPLSNKFGADSNSWKSLLLKAYELDLNVVGVAFHVGSGCTRVDSFTEAFNDTIRLFELSRSLEFEIKAKRSKILIGSTAVDDKIDFHSMNMIDIGGGFPGDTANKHFPAMVKQINDFMNGDWCKQWIETRKTETFNGYDLTFIAEPGRFFAHQSTTLVTSVVGLKICQEDEMMTAVNYYLNDGVYGSFNNLVYDHATVALPVHGYHQRMLQELSKEEDGKETMMIEEVNNSKEVIRETALNGAEKHTKKTPVFFSRFFGPTCDGFDVIMEGEFPLLGEGDGLVWPDMGAYTQAAASKFNGFQPPKKIYLHKISEKKNVYCRRGYI